MIEFVELPFRKGSKSHLSFISFLFKTWVASVTQWFLFPVSTVSTRNAWDHDHLLCPKYEEKNSLKIMSLAAYTSKTTNWRNWKLSSQNVMVIKILYPKHYSTPVCQYTSVFPDNNVKDKVHKTPKVVPVGCIGLWKHNGILSEFGKN